MYQPIPATKPNSLLDYPLQTHQNRFCSVVSLHNDFGMPWKNCKLFIAAFFTKRRKDP